MEQQEFERSMEFYKENFQDLLASYEGRFVAIVDEKVVDSDVEFSALAKRVYGKFTYRDIFMPRVERQPAIAEIRSPRAMPGQES